MIIYNSRVLETHYSSWVPNFTTLVRVVRDAVDLHYSESDRDHYFGVRDDRILLMSQGSGCWAANMVLVEVERAIIIAGRGYVHHIDTELFVHIILATIDDSERTLLLFSKEDEECFGYGIAPGFVYDVEESLVMRRGNLFVSADRWKHNGIFFDPVPDVTRLLVKHKRKLTIPNRLEDNDAKD